MVMFDLPVNISSDAENHINLLMQQLDVTIKMRLKSRQSTHSVTIRGIERCASESYYILLKIITKFLINLFPANVYIATHTLLNLEGPQIKASIPESFSIPNLPEEFSVRNLRKFTLLFTSSTQLCRYLNLILSVNIGGGTSRLRLSNMASASALASPPVFSPTSIMAPRNPWNQMWSSNDPYMHQNSINHQIASNLSVPRIVVPTHSMMPMFPSPDSASKFPNSVSRSIKNFALALLYLK